MTKRVELFHAKEFATAALVDHDKAFVARSWRPRMSPSQSPLSIRTTLTSLLPTPLRSYPSAPELDSNAELSKDTSINDCLIDLIF